MSALQQFRYRSDDPQCEDNYRWIDPHFDFVIHLYCICATNILQRDTYPKGGTQYNHHLVQNEIHPIQLNLYYQTSHSVVLHRSSVTTEHIVRR